MHGELRAALERVKGDASARVLLLTGAGRGFCAGQDLADRAVAPGAAPVDLGHSIETYYRPLVLTLRALPLPVVCAVNGVAAGAGANIALACDIVVATKSASFIQAFCKIGLMPDSGGTWFLPRLVGTARAMGLAMLGDKLSAEQAAAWGLIWKCVDDAEFAARRRSAGRAARARADARSCGDQARALRRRKTNTLAAQLDVERDLQRELGVQRRLPRRRRRVPRQAPAALHRPLTAGMATPPSSRRDGRGHRRGNDGRGHRAGRRCGGPSRVAVRRAPGRRRRGAARRSPTTFDTLAAKGKLGRGRREGGRRADRRRSMRSATASARRSSSRRSSRTSSVKRELFAELEVVVGADAILATNTSSLSVTSLAAGMKHPGRVVGMHFFNPAPVMPLVEVVSGLATRRGRRGARYTPRPRRGARSRCTRRRRRDSSSTAARGRSTARHGACWTSARRSPATIDAVLREAGGFRMGPFELMDLIGHDVNLAVTTSVWQAYHYDPRYTPSVAQRELVDAGYHGRKTRRGIYDYAEGAERPPPRREPSHRAPARVVVRGDAGLAAGLVERVAKAGAAVERAPGASRVSRRRARYRRCARWRSPTDAPQPRARGPRASTTSSRSILRSTTPRVRGSRSPAPTPAATRA